MSAVQYQNDTLTVKDNTFFIQNLIKRGYPIDYRQKILLEKCEDIINKTNCDRQEVLHSHDIICHKFFLLIANTTNYIPYYLLLNYLDRQTLKNLYCFVYTNWNIISDGKDKVHFKYDIEYVDEIFNPDKLKTKIFDSLYRFSKKGDKYQEFILHNIYQYFLN